MRSSGVYKCLRVTNITRTRKPRHFVYIAVLREGATHFPHVFVRGNPASSSRVWLKEGRRRPQVQAQKGSGAEIDRELRRRGVNEHRVEATTSSQTKTRVERRNTILRVYDFPLGIATTVRTLRVKDAHDLRAETAFRLGGCTLHVEHHRVALHLRVTEQPHHPTTENKRPILNGKIDARCIIHNLRSEKE